ncbi:MAG: helix-turn-helix domain-containing protein [Burkholderiaceae bacterium]
MASWLEHRSADVDDQAAALAGWQQHYEQLGRGSFRGAACQLLMSDGVLLREQTNRQLREQIRPPRDHLVIAVPLAVEPGSVFAGRPLERESVVVLDGDHDYELVSAGELDLVGLAVHRRFVEQLSPAEADWLQGAQRQQLLPLAPDAASAIRQMLLVLVGDGASQCDQLADPRQESALLASTLAQTVLLAMLGAAGSSGDPAQAIPRRTESRQRVVRRAIDFMRAHLHEPIGVPDICAAACASRRSLQYCFEEFMHTTPQAYLRALRLNEARRVLKSHANPAITALAGEFGFSSPSHFTRHYRLMFDEVPSETLRLHGEAIRQP